MLQICKDLFDRWNIEAIQYCHWKSNEHLLAGLEGNTDLDILLSKKHEEQAVVILKKLDFLKCKSQYGSRFPDVDDWIGFDRITGMLVHVHLHYNLVTGHKGMKEYSLPWTEMALKTRILNIDYGVYMMEPNLEIVTLFTRIGLKADFRSLISCRIGKFKFSKEHKREIEWLKERINVEKVLELLDIVYGDKANSIFVIMQEETINPKNYLKLQKITECTFKKNSRVKSFMRIRELYYYFYQYCLKQLIKKFKPIMSKKVPASGKGLTIAFIGQDGAGKSTMTEEIEKWLSWKMDVNRYYLGSGDHYQSWQRTLQEKLPKKKDFLLTFITAMLSLSKYKNLAKYILKTIKKSESYKAKGGIALFDRYPQMKYPGINDGPKIRELVNKTNNPLMRRIINLYADVEEKYLRRAVDVSPDIIFKLVLPVEESIKRKPQESLETIKKKHEIINGLEFQTPTYEIDATMDYQQEIIQIKRTIWQNILK